MLWMGGAQGLQDSQGFLGKGRCLVIPLPLLLHRTGIVTRLGQGDREEHLVGVLPVQLPAEDEGFLVLLESRIILPFLVQRTEITPRLGEIMLPAGAVGISAV
jgi:hypothetical protein